MRRKLKAQLIEVGPSLFCREDKKCPKCKEIKSYKLFYFSKQSPDGLSSYCKSCNLLVRRICKNKNPQKYYKKHPRKPKDPQETKEKYRETARKWKINNPEKVKKTWQKRDKKRYSTPKGKLNKAISYRMWASLKGNKVGHHWESLVDYSVLQLKKHIEKQFLPGMTWENYGHETWHIDHIIPISAFNFNSPNDIDFKRCWSLKNLRPLWASENFRKHNKLIINFQPSFSFTMEDN